MVNKARLREYYEHAFYEFESGRGRDKDIFTRSRLETAAGYFHGLKTEGAWLDVGCGFGDFLQEIRGVNRMGLDLSMSFLTSARRVVDRSVLLVQADAGELPFSNDAFEGVIALEVVEHMLEPEKVIRELCRVCGRWLLISLPTDYDWLYSRLGLYKNPYEGSTAQENLEKHVGHISVRPLCELLSDLDRYSFEVHSVRGLYSLIPPPFKLGFHYPDLASPWRNLYRLAVRIDHWLGSRRPFQTLGLDTVILAIRRGAV